MLVQTFLSAQKILRLIPVLLFTWCNPINAQKPDVFYIPELGTVKLSGYAGTKLSDCLVNGVLPVDPDYLVEPFRHREEKWMWQSEFWGKWITSAIDGYRYNKDPRLLAKIKEGVTGLISTQTPDGYIGNYAPEYRLQQWDIWGMKYCLLGLIDYYEISKDIKALNAAKKLADYVISAVYATNKPYNQFGNHMGMAASSILEPIVKLYNISKQPSYLKFADFIVASWSKPDASQLIEKGIQKIPVGDRFPTPAVWYGPLQGKKAYEMMSCYEGLMELYRVKGNPEYLQAIVNTAENIRKDEISIIGTGASMEGWLNGAKIQSTPLRHPNETCVTATWAKFCLQLLRTTGDVKWANEIEKTFYNGLLGAMTPDGHTWNKYTDIRGLKYLGENQCNMNINCCVANGPRGMMVLPKEAFMTYADGIVINFYAPSTANLNLNKNVIGIEVKTDYPKGDEINIQLNPANAKTFGLKVRIPEWSKNNTLTVNGESVGNVEPGTYKEIKRIWKKGDIVNLKLDMEVREYYVKGDSTKYSLLYGPLVLASDNRFQQSPFYSYYTPVKEKGQIPFAMISDNKKDIYLEMKIPFLKEIIGDNDVKENLILTDFASAGNTWDKESAYLIWFTKPKDPTKDK